MQGRLGELRRERDQMSGKKVGLEGREMRKAMGEIL